MKKFMCFAFALFICAGIQAQSATFSFKNVDESDVPSEVQVAQATNFPGVNIRQWKQHSASNENKSGSVYLAVFTSSGQNSRAKYTASGKGISVYTTIALSASPDVVTTYVENNQSAYELTRVASIESLKNGAFVYRINLRQGAKKLTVFLDKNGNEVSQNSLPDEIEDEV